jgi:hypothetical protein
LEAEVGKASEISTMLAEAAHDCVGSGNGQGNLCTTEVGRPMGCRIVCKTGRGAPPECMSRGQRVNAVKASSTAASTTVANAMG